MSKFKQLTATEFRTKISNTNGTCRTDDGMLTNCSDFSYQDQSSCTGAGGTWTASFTKAACLSQIPAGIYADSTFSWEGDRYVDTEDNVISLNLEKVLNWEPTKDLITKLPLATHTHVISEDGKYDIKQSLREWMEIMAVEVPE